jgi:hypothetical protein
MTERSQPNSATPRPWAADPDEREGYEWNIHIVEAADPHMRIAFTSNGPGSEANAALIVKAVNNHDALVRALEEIAEGVGRYSHNAFEHACNTIEDMKQIALDALARLEAKS